MIGERDARIRQAAFDWLTEKRDEYGEALPRSVLTSFRLDGVTIGLVGPQGIWKPAACELPISATTVCDGPYGGTDAFDDRTGRLTYAYRNAGPDHWANSGLRRTMTERVPIIYFHCLRPSWYVAMYPAFVVADDPSRFVFTIQFDDVNAVASTGPLFGEYPSEATEARRAYVTRTVRQRLHQAAFRERVIQAYQDRCALCSLRHLELLDAAHITPDNDPLGEPIVANGVALCKLHHAAFDRFFFAIRPDYTIEVRPSILVESDGPMLVVGLQQIHDKRILVPRRSDQRPDPVRLDRRYQEFLRAS